VIVVRPAELGDVKAIADLLEELDRFYGATETQPLDERVRGIEEALFGTPPTAYALLAWDDASLAGLASYSFLWPAAGVTRSLYLKELYVRQDRRRSGVGRVLMDELYAIAVARGCSRVEWTTETDNVAAQGFYEALGAERLEGKVFYRISGLTS
jgi:ribosomal protein S18 acetylase RimI-like enzyme